MLNLVRGLLATLVLFIVNAPVASAAGSCGNFQTTALDGKCLRYQVVPQIFAKSSFFSIPQQDLSAVRIHSTASVEIKLRFFSTDGNFDPNKPFEYSSNAVIEKGDKSFALTLGWDGKGTASQGKDFLALITGFCLGGRETCPESVLRYDRSPNSAWVLIELKSDSANTLSETSIELQRFYVGGTVAAPVTSVRGWFSEEVTAKWIIPITDSDASFSEVAILNPHEYTMFVRMTLLGGDGKHIYNTSARVNPYALLSNKVFVREFGDMGRTYFGAVPYSATGSFEGSLMLECFSPDEKPVQCLPASYLKEHLQKYDTIIGEGLGIETKDVVPLKE